MPLRDKQGVTLDAPPQRSGSTAIPAPRPPSSRPQAWRRRQLCSAIAIAALAVVLAQATTDALPDQPVFWLFTPLRLVVLLGLAALLCADRIRPVVLPPRPSALGIAVLALVASGAIAALRTGHGWASWRALLTAIAVAYLATGIRRIAPASWLAITHLALFAVAIAATSALAQVANGVPTGFCRGALDGSADTCLAGSLIRATGPFANPNLLAPFLVLLVPIAGSAVGRADDLHTRTVLALPLVAAAAAVLVTWSRGGMCAAIAAALTFVVVARPSRLRLYLGGGAVVAALLGVTALLSLGFSAGVRTSVWRAAMTLAGAHPWGSGMGRSGALIDHMVPGDERFRHAHNLWLTWLVETGWLGLSATVAISVILIARLVRAAKSGHASVPALAAALTGFFVASLVDHPANAERLALTLAVVVGLAAAEKPAVATAAASATSHSRR
ncbi:O-antigen ligase family protein [Gephyromycinifex aptenodytis]|uniref:O-antigen ligase family protein n=1 Tax=Gephyromycinifex aptenodytis TaxID=2716227 RepID=UPI0014469E60|nr:O-antigen ligase family protein [Gephyromycinifex aptenodytis]